MFAHCLPQKCSGTNYSWLWKLRPWKQPSHSYTSFQGNRGLPCKQEVGLKETAHNLVGCFNDEVKADCQEYPAVFIVKRASIVGKGGGKNEQGCYLLISGVWILFVFGACQSSSKKKK